MNTGNYKMKSTELIRFLLDSSKGWAMGLIDAIKDAPLTQPTANGGNHPLWLVGHLLHSESNLLDVFILGKENRFAEWDHLFRMGTTPTTNAEDYPTMDELLAKFAAMRAASLAHLDTLSEDDLDQPSRAPEEFGAYFGTVGACFAAMSTHTAFHTGQIAVCRKAAGREPVMA
jgi:uncharacterized damage-inducible protein DinB